MDFTQEQHSDDRIVLRSSNYRVVGRYYPAILADLTNPRNNQKPVIRAKGKPSSYWPHCNQPCNWKGRNQIQIRTHWLGKSC